MQRANSPTGGINDSRCWRVVRWVILLFVLALLIQTSLRIIFPWDMYSWPESPFLTDMMKLDRHQSIYSPPGDGNSMVYSPGLAYLTHFLLKPFGAELDIRFCRLVTLFFGLMASVCASLAMVRFIRAADGGARSPFFFALTLGIACLAVFKNCLADVPHPDNLHALHVLAVFWLCYSAVNTGRLSLAVFAMALAGLGVLTKQTNAFCFLGPAVAFALLKPWGWGRQLMLFFLGGAVFGFALWLLWRPEYARFYTFDLLRHNKMNWNQIRNMPGFLMVVDRGLFLLVPFPVLYLWRMGREGRKYLACWASMGIFSVLPNFSAFFKVNGTWNNLNLFEVWGVLVIWPFLFAVLNRVGATDGGPSPVFFGGLNHKWATRAPMLFLVVFTLYLLPTKLPMRAVHYQFCRELESAVRSDLAAGRKVLVSHGTEFLLRAGATEIPQDRANSVTELIAGQSGERSEMRSRIREHYYDRIYLIMGVWYGEEMLKEIHQDYQVETTLPEPSPTGLKLPLGSQRLMSGCEILIPRY